MSEVSLYKELCAIEKRPSLKECYLSFIKNALFLDKKYSEIPHKKLENAFSDKQKFQELKESFRKIFSREKGKYCIFGNQKKVLKKYYGLDDGDAYYLHTDGVEEIAEELGLNNQEAKILKEAGEQNFHQAENYNLLPEWLKKIAEV